MWYWEGLLVCLQQTWRPGQVWVLVCQVLAGFDTSGCGGEDLHPGEGLFLHYGLPGMRGHRGWGRGLLIILYTTFNLGRMGWGCHVKLFCNELFEKMYEELIIIFHFRNFSITH